MLPAQNSCPSLSIFLRLNDQYSQHPFLGNSNEHLFYLQSYLCILFLRVSCSGANNGTSGHSTLINSCCWREEFSSHSLTAPEEMPPPADLNGGLPGIDHAREPGVLPDVGQGHHEVIVRDEDHIHCRQIYQLGLRKKGREWDVSVLRTQLSTMGLKKWHCQRQSGCGATE